MISDADFCAAWARCYSGREAARVLGMSSTAAYMRARKLGLPRKTRRGPPPNTALAERVYALRQTGMTYRQIAAKVGGNAANIWRHCKRVELRS